MYSEIRNILIPLNGGGNIDSVLKTGFAYAKLFNAHLSTVLVGDDPNEAAALAGEGLSGAMIHEMMEAAEHESQRRMLQIRLKFDSFVEEHGIVREHTFVPGRLPEGDRVSATLELLTGSEHEAVTWRARLSDMTLMPHLSLTDNVRASETLHAVLFDSGRPLVIAPVEPPKTFGKRICIAWNGTSEASAALRAVLPWAHQADEVQVLYSPEYHRRGPEAEKVLDYLQLHGIQATIAPFGSKERNVGVGLLEACQEFGADMLAMGAYSHSRLRQMIIGGVTRHVLEKAKLVVLMSR
ncbi:universal stress protein [Kozakia baliensis]|uniref:universal stress protein n=1 Tax=Kozakia baliensis TaxID=153496 RepID=UPI000495B456|nr:universal stress protein [Kozakia baliensis]AOX19448.1 universal stress protein UspA [Kozakia baliensis]